MNSKYYVPSKLDKDIQILLKLIIDPDMIDDTFAKNNVGKDNVDEEKLKDAADILERILNEILNKSSPSRVRDLSNTFYKIIPHNYGKFNPPDIETQEQVNEKMYMLNVLRDIEITRVLLENINNVRVNKPVENIQVNLQSNSTTSSSYSDKNDIIENNMLDPEKNFLDFLYEKLGVALNLLKDDSSWMCITLSGMNNVRCFSHHPDTVIVDGYFNEQLFSRHKFCTSPNVNNNTDHFNLIRQYVDNTTTKKLEIVNIWEVNIPSEVEKFEIHEKISNRKLLWHGTDIASVASILLEGLKRDEYKCKRQFGDGIYFASVFDKAAKYMTCNKLGYGVIFLSEVILGNMENVTEYKEEYEKLKKPNKGYDSVVGQGRFEPDPSEDKYIYLDGKIVTVPIGKTVRKSYSKLCNSEYVIYHESQCRIRFLLLCKF